MGEMEEPGRQDPESIGVMIFFLRRSGKIGRLKNPILIQTQIEEDEYLVRIGSFFETSMILMLPKESYST